MKNRFLVLTLAATCVLAPAALADNLNASQRAIYDQRPESSDKDWKVVLGAGALVQPEYEGGDEYEFMALPYIDITYMDRVQLNIEGLNVKVIKEDHFNAGVGIGADFGRDDSDDDRLRGLGDIDATAEGRLFAEYTPGAASAKIVFAQDLADGHEGYTVEADAGYRFVLPETRTFIRPSVGTTYASEDYMDSYFGVDAGQSARSGLRAFDSDAGFKDVNAGVFVSQKLSEHWSVNGLAQYSRLLGDAADSPIVEDENQFQTGVFVAYTF